VVGFRNLLPTKLEHSGQLRSRYSRPPYSVACGKKTLLFTRCVSQVFFSRFQGEFSNKTQDEVEGNMQQGKLHTLLAAIARDKGPAYCCIHRNKWKERTLHNRLTIQYPPSSTVLYCSLRSRASSRASTARRMRTCSQGIAMILTWGRARRIVSPVPTMVPPVPHPATK